MKEKDPDIGIFGQEFFNKKMVQFGDAFAREIDWRSLTQNGKANFKYRSISKELSGSLHYKPSRQLKIWVVGFPIAFIVFGLLAISQSFIYVFKIHVLLFGILMVVVGIIAFIRGIDPIVFDAKHKLFYKGNPQSPSKTIPFDDIYAIQIVDCYGDSPLELNLVLKNKERFNVVSHPDKKAIIEDADVLSKFLSIPIWNFSK